jgi:hypothetical protein
MSISGALICHPAKLGQCAHDFHIRIAAVGGMSHSSAKEPVEAHSGETA